MNSLADAGYSYPFSRAAQRTEDLFFETRPGEATHQKCGEDGQIFASFVVETFKFPARLPYGFVYPQTALQL
jgi:hypothetical protein